MPGMHTSDHLAGHKTPNYGVFPLTLGFATLAIEQLVGHSHTKLGFSSLFNVMLVTFEILVRLLLTSTPNSEHLVLLRQKIDLKVMIRHD